MAVSKDNVRILITVPIEVKKELENAARRENRSVSNYVCNLIVTDLSDAAQSQPYRAERVIAPSASARGRRAASRTYSHSRNRSALKAKKKTSY